MKFDAQAAQHVVYVNYAPDLSTVYVHAGLIFSDCINNLRIALDYLAFQLALWHTNGNILKPDDITFPIVREAKNWRGVQGRQLAEIHPDHRALIESFQPYSRTHVESVDPFGVDRFHPLELLWKLTNDDKHRLLTTIAIPTRGLIHDHARDPSFVISTILAWAAKQSIQVSIEPIKLDAEIARAELSADFPKSDMDVASYVSPEIALAEGPYRPVLPVVDTLAAFVVKILREFEPLL